MPSIPAHSRSLAIEWWGRGARSLLSTARAHGKRRAPVTTGIRILVSQTSLAPAYKIWTRGCQPRLADYQEVESVVELSQERKLRHNVFVIDRISGVKN
jgi:hypothetical protein